MDRDASFYYEITSRQNLRLVLERKRISLTELVKLLEGLENAAATCEEYLLDSERILLQPGFYLSGSGYLEDSGVLLSL